MTSLLLAVQFLTRIPVWLERPHNPATMGRSMRWFPLVGAGIGGIVALVDWGLSPFLGTEVRSVLAIIVLALVTGGLHLDGFMDSCDGLLAFTSPARRLEIMADSRVGSFAIVGLTTLLLLKYAAIAAVPELLRPWAFVVMGAQSRWAMVFATVCFPTARPGGLGATLKQGAGRVELFVATLLASATALSLPGAGILALGITVLLTLGLARYALLKIGGLTGDVYGAISEVVEVSILIVLPPLHRALA